MADVFIFLLCLVYRKRLSTRCQHLTKGGVRELGWSTGHTCVMSQSPGPWELILRTTGSSQWRECCLPLNCHTKVVKMAQWVTAPLTKPDNLSSIPWLMWCEFCKLSSNLHTHCDMCGHVPTRMHTHKIKYFWCHTSPTSWYFLEIYMNPQLPKHQKVIEKLLAYISVYPIYMHIYISSVYPIYMRIYDSYHI